MSGERLLIAKLAGDEEKAGLEHTHGRGDGHRVEVLDAYLGDEAVVRLQRDLEDVALLRLHQKEEHGLRLVRRTCHNNNATIHVVQVALCNWNTIILTMFSFSFKWIN